MCEERKSFNEELSAFMMKVSGEKVDIAAKVYFMLVKEENPGENLRFFLERADEIKSSGAEEVEKYVLPAQVGR